MCEYRSGKHLCTMIVIVVEPIMVLSTNLNPLGERSACEHTCWDPKDGELCMNRVKPGKTLVEARSNSDVQSIVKFWYNDKILIEPYSNLFPPKFSEG